jgi:hypothetical protein
MATQVSKLLIRLTKYSGKVSNVIDATNSFNSKGFFVQDLSGWDFAVIQTVGTVDGPITFKTTNNDDSVTGLLLPAPEVVVDWVDVMGTNLSTNTKEIDNGSNNSLWEFGIIGKYLVLVGDVYDNPLSSAYYLPIQGNSNTNIAIEQGISNGSRVVYASTAVGLNGSSFYYDSLLTQKVYGVGSSEWFYVKRKIGMVNYLLYINPNGEIVLD